MLTQKDNEEIPLYRDFFHFLYRLFKRIAYYCLTAFNLLVNFQRGVICLLPRIKKAMVRILMRRKNAWIVSRINLTSVIGTLVTAVIFIPGLQIFSIQDQLDKKLIVDSFSEGSFSGLALGTQDILVQNNITVTTINEGAQRVDIIEYIVQTGDTLFDIGQKFNVTKESLVYINGISNENLISPGDTLKIPPVTGLIHEVKSGETVSSIASKWNISPQAIVDINYLDEPYLLSVGQELVVPREEMPAPVVVATAPSVSNNTTGLQIVPSSGGGTGSLSMPAVGRLTQYFSWYHTAIDIANSCGTPIVAADSGTITFAGWWPGGGGNSIFISHGNGYLTKYAHMSGFARRSGYVNKGEIIGYIGATGRAYGCHIHFIVERYGRAINPLGVIK